MKQNTTKFIFVAVAIATLGLTVTARGRTSDLRKSWPGEVDELYLPPSNALAKASLGHKELFADLIAARANIYFGDQMITKGAQRWLSYYMNTVVDLDPHFYPIYVRGAVMMLYASGKVTLEGVMSANQLLRRGLETYPRDWEMWFQLGFNLAFETREVVPPGDPRLVQWKREGTEYIRRSTYFDGVPAYLPSLVATMLTKEGEQELAVSHLEQLYTTTSDPATRFQIAAKLKALSGENVQERFETDLRKMLREHSSRYPYAPEAFSIVAGDRPVRGIRLENLGQP